jgi:hypothetical protein
MQVYLSDYHNAPLIHVTGPRVRYGVSSIYGLSRSILLPITPLHVCNVHGADVDTATCLTIALGESYLSLLA